MNILSGSTIPMTEAIVLMTSMAFDYFGIFSRIFFKTVGRVLIPATFAEISLNY